MSDSYFYLSELIANWFSDCVDVFDGSTDWDVTICTQGVRIGFPKRSDRLPQHILQHNSISNQRTRKSLVDQQNKTRSSPQW